VDLDHEIEKTSKQSVHQIFDTYGEAYFRSLETEHLKTFSTFQGIIACGGGIVLNETHKDIMKHGFTIFIHTSLDTLNKRAKKSYERPLLKLQSLDIMYQKRSSLYQSFASYTIHNDHTMEALIVSLKKYIQERL
jgi:shikimate kinase